MNVRSRIALSTLAAGVALCALVQPASASAGKLNCDLGGGRISCELDSVGVRASFHGEAWRFDGVPKPGDDGHLGVSYPCTAGSAVSVSVSYYDQAGTPYFNNFAGTCS